MIIEFEFFNVDCDYQPKEYENQVDESLDINDITICDVSILNIIKWANKLDDVEQMCLDYIRGF